MGHLNIVSDTWIWDLWTCAELNKLFDLIVYKNIHSLSKTTVRHFFPYLSDEQDQRYK